MTLSRPRILKWLDLRFATGFSDWLSNISYDTDLLALLSLVDFCKEEEIRLRAAMVIDLILFDIAANSYAGVFGSSHGRSFEQSVKWASQENTTDTQKLLFGRGVFSGSENLSAFAFALSQRYRMPHSIFGIANDLERPEMLQRQRMGIHIDQAEWWGLKPDGFENGMHLLTMGAYLHPKTARLFIKMLDKFHWWGNKLLRPYNARKWFLKILRLTGLLSFTMRLFEYDACRSSHEEVNLYTYRTPDFMLSSAQDYQKGFGGDQHQIWQATLGPDAVCFTTHPARHQGLPPNYWTGSGFLPRVAQIKNVAIIIYRLEKKPALFVQNELLMTHAWLPRGKFDETVEEDGWIFARYGDGFLALFSQHPYKWQHKPGQDQFNEIIVQARDNIWVCELGRRSTDVSFSNFRARILQAPLLFSHLSVSYLSPSQGQIAFGWDGPLSLDGRVISQKDYPRYGSPYSQTSFPTEIISINFESQNLTLNWKTIDRQSDSYI